MQLQGRDTHMDIAATTSILRGRKDPAPSSLLNVYDQGNTLDAPKPLTAAEVKSSTDKVLRDTVTNASKMLDFLHTEFGRKGLDGKGTPMDLIVHAGEPDPRSEEYGGAMTNAYWNMQSKKMYIGDAGIAALNPETGKASFGPFGRALDVMAHEAGHAILNSEVKLKLSGQGGALHESFGDVLGALIDPYDWQIGEDAKIDAQAKRVGFRNLSRPSVVHHMKDVQPNTEVHDLADIPNLAAVRVSDELGRKNMGQIWYQGFTKFLPANAEFPEAAMATVQAAEAIYGSGSRQSAAVRDAWASVGVLEAAAKLSGLAATKKSA